MEYSETEKVQAEVLRASTGQNRKRPRRPRRAPRAVYIVQEGEDGPIFRIETPESYAGRKNLSSKSPSSLKKLARIKRVRERGYVKRVATNQDIRRYGPAIVMGAEEEAA